jgi:hypothetical protein
VKIPDGDLIIDGDENDEVFQFNWTLGLTNEQLVQQVSCLAISLLRVVTTCADRE